LQDLNTFIGGGTINAIPSGGSTNQVLTKHSNTSYDVQWSSVSSEIAAGTNIVVTGTSPATISTATSPNFTSITVANNKPISFLNSTGTADGALLEGSAGGLFFQMGTAGVMDVADHLTNPVVTVQGIGNAGPYFVVTGATTAALSQVNVLASFSSSTPTTGALTVAGGLGVAESLNVGSNIVATGNITATGTVQGTSFTGAVPVASLNSGSGATNTTFFRGDGIWVAPASSAYTFLGTVAVSGGVIATTGIFTSAYSNYELVLVNINPTTTAATGLFNFYSGTTVQNTATTYQNSMLLWNSNGVTTQNVINTAGQLTASGLVSNTTGMNGVLRVINPSATSGAKAVNGPVVHLTTTSPSPTNASVGVIFNGVTTALTGFQISYAGATASSGVVEVYGLT
jgi:hypothetical protein